MESNPQEKHSSSIRLKDWDYSQDWYYFITICTRDRVEAFGTVVEEKVELSASGLTVEKLWSEIPVHFPFVGLDEYVIMPDHIHGIVILDHLKDDQVPRDAINRIPTNTPQMCSDAIHRVSCRDAGGVTKDKNPMVANDSLSGAIRWFKGRSTYEIHKTNNDFSWQPRFYDRIIRDERELGQVREYIKYNPLKWDLDQDHPDNLEF